VPARHARIRRLADALCRQALAALSSSRGAHAQYDTHRGGGNTHRQAPRALADRLVPASCTACLWHHTVYDESQGPGRPHGDRRL